MRCLQMLSEVIANFNESLLVEDEQYVLVVDLFIVRPELQLQVTGDRRASTPPAQPPRDHVTRDT